MQDYNDYHFGIEEICFYLIFYIGYIIMISYLFYRSVFACIFLSPILYFQMKKKKKELCQKQKAELLRQFREMILTVSSNLKVGYSMENAFSGSYRDVIMLFGTDSMIARELKMITIGLQNNQVLEDMLLYFAHRSGLEDIRDFAEIFSIAKRSGGDMNGMIRNTVNAISDKIQVNREIETMIRAREFEQKIMSMIPFGIIFYMSLTSKGFLTPLYHNIKGNLIMTGCLLLYVFANWLSERMMQIKI